jgi:ADP-L-glycero-D-manno-heptose 6-epimerase
MKKKVALITGEQGFIGSNLYVELVKRFESVIGIEEDIFNNDGWAWYIQHLIVRDKVDAVFHVGACSDTLETDANLMMTRNFEFTRILAEVCQSQRIPIIYSSSAANYGVNWIHPSNLYGWSKYAGEYAVLQAGGIALRYFNVYGPGEEHKGNMASVAYQMWNKHKNGKEVKLFLGRPQRDFIYVKDVVSANLYAYDNYLSLPKNYYDIGTCSPQSFETVLEELDIPYTYHDESATPEGYQFFTCANPFKLLSVNTQDKWSPKYSLKEGLAEYKKYLLS